MINKTNNYEMFTLRADNRECISAPHVKKLVESIRYKNLLELRPIVVNEKYEVLDGQHRLLAAKELGVDIYYQVQKEINHEDIIIMNTSKAWTLGDFLNYYVKNNYSEYLKLQAFMKKNGVGLQISLAITMGTSRVLIQEFKEGKYKYKDDVVDANVDKCWEICGIIKKFNGHSPYVNSSRFWNAMLKLVNHGQYDHEKFKNNLMKNVSKFCAKATQNDYYMLLMDCNNWHNRIKIDLMEE